MRTLRHISFLLLCSIFAGCGGGSDSTFTSVSGSLTNSVSDSPSADALSVTRLGFLSQPTRAGEDFSILQVGVYDDSGALVPVDGIVVRLSSPDLPLEGDTSEATVGGVATFDGVFTELAGAGTLVATAPGLREARSARFVIGPNDPQTLRLDFQPADVEVGENFNFSLVVTDRFGNPTPGIEVNLEVLEAGLDQAIPTSGALSVTTDASGVAIFNGLRASLSRTAFLRISAAGIVADSGHFNINQAASLFDTWRVVQPGQSVPNGFAFDGLRYVIVGTGGLVYTSDDAENFEARTSGTAVDLLAVEFGAGLFVAVGLEGTILTSPDGTLWTERDSTVTVDLKALAFGTFDFGERFVAVGDNGTILLSSNGVDWSKVDIGRSEDINVVAYGLDRFASLLTGTGFGRLLSFNGTSWSRGSSISGMEMNDIAYGPQGFVAVSQRETIWYSPDGDSWTDVSTGDDFIHYTSVTYHSGRYLIGGSNLSGEILVSTDGKTWATESTNLTIGINRLESVGSFLIGSFTDVWTSLDGLTWTRRIEPLEDFDDVLFTAGEWVAVGYNQIAHSSDGEFWNPLSGGFPVLTDLTAGHQHLVAVGAGGAIYTTTDRRTWTEVPQVVNQTLRGVAFGNGLYVAVGDSGSMVRSDVAATSWLLTDIGSVRSWDVAFGAGLFAAVGDDRSIRTSPDGVNWTIRLAASGSSDFRGVEYQDGRFVAVGEDGLLATSTDGITWDPSNIGVSGEDFLGVNFGGGLWIAVGTNGAVVTSPDLVNWTLRDSVGSGPLEAVAVGNGKAVAVGRAPSVIVSP